MSARRRVGRWRCDSPGTRCSRINCSARRGLAAVAAVAAALVRRLESGRARVSGGEACGHGARHLRGSHAGHDPAQLQCGARSRHVGPYRLAEPSVRVGHVLRGELALAGNGTGDLLARREVHNGYLVLVGSQLRRMLRAAGVVDRDGAGVTVARLEDYLSFSPLERRTNPPRRHRPPGFVEAARNAGSRTCRTPSSVLPRLRSIGSCRPEGSTPRHQRGLTRRRPPADGTCRGSHPAPPRPGSRAAPASPG